MNVVSNLNVPKILDHSDSPCSGRAQIMNDLPRVDSWVPLMLQHPRDLL